MSNIEESKQVSELKSPTETFIDFGGDKEYLGRYDAILLLTRRDEYWNQEVAKKDREITHIQGRFENSKMLNRVLKEEINNQGNEIKRLKSEKAELHKMVSELESKVGSLPPFDYSNDAIIP